MHRPRQVKVLLRDGHKRIEILERRKAKSGLTPTEQTELEVTKDHVARIKKNLKHCSENHEVVIRYIPNTNEQYFREKYFSAV